MKNTILIILSLFSRIYASYLLALTVLLFPPLLFLNQSLVFSISPPLFQSSILQQNVLEALRIVLLGSSTSTVFVQSEASHLKDVHVLFVFFYLFGLINLIIFNWKLKYTKVKRVYFIAAGIALIGICLLGGFFFEPVFELFHETLFPQGNFAFPVDSMIIQTFPPGFWLLQFVEIQTLAVLSLLFQFRAAD